MRPLAILILSLALLPAADCPYRLLLSDMLTHELQIREIDGSISRRVPTQGNCFDGAMLGNGNLLYAWYGRGKQRGQAGVREISPNDNLVFEFPIAKECHSVQRLADGSTLIADPTARRLLQVDQQGKELGSLALDISHTNTHRVCRIARRQADGSTLVVQESDQAILRYGSDGSVQQRLEIGAKAYDVEQLANGNLLVGTGNGKSVIEYAADGSEVWRFAASDFPEETNLEWIVCAQRLANGNTLIGNWLGHGKNGHGISLLEVQPDKSVAWTLREPRIINVVQILD